MNIFIGTAFTFAAFIAAASAFKTPFVGSSRNPSFLQAIYRRSNAADMVGALPPIGFFDPLNLSEGKSEAELKKWREAELKHGRVAMLACAGFFMQERIIEGRVPVLFNIINGPAINHFQEFNKLFSYFPVAVLFAISLVEGQNILQGWESPKETMRGGTGVAMLKKNYINGDLGFDPLNMKPKDQEVFDIRRTKELQNGRLAMIGIAGMVAQELVTGTKIF